MKKLEMLILKEFKKQCNVVLCNKGLKGPNDKPFITYGLGFKYSKNITKMHGRNLLLKAFLKTTEIINKDPLYVRYIKHKLFKDREELLIRVV